MKTTKQQQSKTVVPRGGNSVTTITPNLNMASLLQQKLLLREHHHQRAPQITYQQDKYDNYGRPVSEVAEYGKCQNAANTNDERE